LDDVKESISNRPKEELVKCASCPNKCTMSIRCKASSLTPIKDNYLYFCTYSCFQKYFGSSSGKTWSAYIESKQPKKDKKEKKETNKEKGKDDDSDEESSHEEDEEGYVVEDEEQHTDKKRKASTPPKPTTKKAPAKKAAAKDKDKKINKIIEYLEDEIVSFIGLKFEDFQDLYQNTIRLQKTKTETRGTKSKYSIRGQLFITLCWLRHYPKRIVLSAFFKISQTTVEEYTSNTLDLLYPLCQENFDYYFSKRMDKEHYSIYVKDTNESCMVTSVADGSEQRISVPMDSEIAMNFYSGKKGYFSITKLVFCTPTGKIIFMSKSRPGSRNDINLANESRAFYSKLDEVLEFILGDKGFIGCHGMYKHFLVNDRNPKASFNRGEADKRFKAIRIIIENVFAHMKKWEACKATLRIKFSDPSKILQQHDQIWSVVGYLTNKYKNIRGL
ncbi:hypothetical protein DFA_06849, partial [Cavenderia fasciculata]